MEKNNNNYSKLCKVIWLLMLVVMILSVIEAAKMYKYYQLYPQKEFTVSRYNPNLPEEALIKIELINNVRYLLAVGLSLLSVFFYCDYRAEPENHWLTKVIKLIKGIKVEE